jgi:hypothetical protein
MNTPFNVSFTGSELKAQKVQQDEVQIKIFGIGFVVLMSGFVSLLGFTVFNDKTGCAIFFMHFLNAVGLLIMTNAQLDMNALTEIDAPLSSRCAFFLILVLITTMALENPVFWAAAAIVGVWFFGQRCRACYFKATAVAAGLLSLLLLAQGYGNILTACNQFTPPTAFALTSCVYFVGSSIVWLAYSLAFQSALGLDKYVAAMTLNEPTVRLIVSIFVYLVVNGLGTLTEQLVKVLYYKLDADIGAWGWATTPAALLPSEWAPSAASVLNLYLY